MIHRFVLKAIFCEPLTCPAMEFRHKITLLYSQSLLEQIRKEMVVAIPASFFVKGDDKQIGLFQRVQHLMAVLLLGNGIAERAAQTLENGSPQQEISQLLGLTVQHLLGQIVRNISIISLELFKETRWIFAPMERQSCQLQTGNPSFGAPFEQINILG